MEVYSLPQLLSMVYGGLTRGNIRQVSETYQKAFSSGIRSNNKPAKKFIACMYLVTKFNDKQYDDDDTNNSNDEEYHQ